MFRKILMTASCIAIFGGASGMDIESDSLLSPFDIKTENVTPSNVAAEEMRLAIDTAAKVWKERYETLVFSDQETFKRFLLDVYAGGYKEFGCLCEPLLRYREELASFYTDALLNKCNLNISDNKSPNIQHDLSHIALVYLLSAGGTRNGLWKKIDNQISKVPLDCKLPESVKKDPDYNIISAVVKTVPLVKQLDMTIYLFLWRYLYEHHVVNHKFPKCVVGQ
jgi:hypothetical protein